MSYTIDGNTYTLEEIQDILSGIGNPSSDLQEAALDIQEAIDRGEYYGCDKWSFYSSKWLTVYA